MNTSITTKLLAVFCAITFTASALAAEQDVTEKMFEAKPGGTLEMRVDRGSIKILSADSGKVEIKVVRELKRGSKQEARQAYEKHKIEMTQNGDTVLIRAEQPSFLKGLKNSQRNLQVDYTI